ncbi:thiamine/thiamine pyrophosphate ABC transporter permease ThiP [Avibacterium sp. 20-15]|uniref:thiamine/thiamine pyrophosphate ABC transporter permease ThiP n=1 Tax=unclassified Avibacterium TaxID=2685287 RepID=UPI002025DD7A|nr:MULTISPECIES: thiamine/thiamine pyrophosphate ABC transporter permease ThiP [unclassified Avibacterium]MCW9733678.1 thiamine/thiamine pyrophosphate ABC transporter permease ThiP [Avibacterium sp. 20-15]URL05498.1 thiamine/thiamine pyrophosphate ABC transporter permease ThiP [Avibacterium sp. 20-132]
MLGGMGVILLLATFYGFTLSAVLNLGNHQQWTALWKDDYIRHVIAFSFGQAFLSAFLSVSIGLLFARAFFYQDFRGKSLILKLFSLTFVLPALVAVLGLLGIYGHSGWVARLFSALEIDWKPNIYGLSGILIAHLFFNIPLASRLFLQALSSIPNQQRQLSSQLNIRGWQFIRLIELPYLRQQFLPAFALIFMLCFTSFAIVLTLGGGPAYTTLEVAIYQAILFEFDLPKAAMLALLQCGFCVLLLMMSSFFHRKDPSQLDLRQFWREKQTSAVQIWQVFCVGSVLIFIFLPLLYMVVAGLDWDAWQKVAQNPQLWRALGYSLSIALCSALFAIVFSMALLLLVLRLAWQSHRYCANVISNMGMIVLAIPTLVVALGLFIRLQDLDFQPWHLLLIVAFCNGILAMPFVIRTLSAPMYQTMQYERLCQSLGVQGWQRWRVVEWQTLRSAMRYASALACALSLGDFTAIALFGNQDFISLPYLLYQQLGSYRMQEASVTALILLGLCGLLFMMIEKPQNVA